MIKMGCLLFGLCVVLCFVPDLSPMVAQSETLLVIEECDFADKASSAVPGANGLVVWFEIAAPCRKRRPYRNPLRKLRKRLRHSRRQARRRLKKKAGQRSFKRGKTVDEPKPNSTAEAVENVEKIPARNKLGRPATIVTNHVFCPTDTCRGFHVMDLILITGS